MGITDFRKNWSLKPQWYLLTLFCLLLFFYFPVVFLGRTLTTSGSVPGVMPEGPFGYGRPSPVFVADPGQSAWMDESYAFLAGHLLKSGQPPLWNPYNGLGTPLLADMLSSVFYPLKLFVYALPNPLGWDVFFLLRILLSGFFMFGFVRSLGISVPGSLTAAVAYMFSGPLTLWVNAFHLNADILLPLHFWIIELLVQRSSPLYVSLSGGILAISLLGGNPQPTILFLSASAVYYFVRKLQVNDSNSFSRAAKSTSVNFAIILLLGLSLSAFQLLPFVEMFRIGANVHGGCGLASAPFKEILAYVFPTLYHHDFPRSRLAIGCLTLCLAAAGILPGKNFRVALILASIGLFSVLKYFGVWPAQWIGYLPVFDHLLFTKYIPALTAFSIAALAGFGTDQLVDPEHRTLSIKTVSFLGAVLVIFMIAVYPVKKSILTLGGCGLIVLMTALIITLRQWKYRPDSSMMLAAVPFLIFLELFFVKPSVHSKRYDPFTEPPFVRFLKKQPPEERIYSLDGTLVLDTSAGFLQPNLSIIASVYESRFMSFCETIDRVYTTRADDPFRLFGVRTACVYPEKKEHRLLHLAGIKYLLTDYPIETGSVCERIIRDGVNEKGVALSDQRTWNYLRRFGTDSQYVFFQHPPSKITFPLDVPGNAEKLEFGYGLDPQTWSPKRGDGVTFALLVETQGKSETLFERYIDPKNNAEDRQWFRSSISLKKYRGQQIQFSFMTDPGPEHNSAYDWAGWGNLAILPPEEVKPYGYLCVYDRELKIYKDPEALPRAYVCHAVVTLKDEKQILATLMDSDFDLTKKAIVERDQVPVPETKETHKDEVRFLSYDPQRIKLEVTTDKPGLLVLSDLYYPGWHAYVHGQPAEILRTNYLLRGVQVMPGVSEIDFIYKPVSFYLGLSIAFLVLAIGLIPFAFHAHLRILSLILILMSLVLAGYFSRMYNKTDINVLYQTIKTGKLPDTMI